MRVFVDKSMAVLTSVVAESNARSSFRSVCCELRSIWRFEVEGTLYYGRNVPYDDTGRASPFTPPVSGPGVLIARRWCVLPAATHTHSRWTIPTAHRHTARMLIASFIDVRLIRSKPASHPSVSQSKSQTATTHQPSNTPNDTPQRRPAVMGVPAVAGPLAAPALTPPPAAAAAAAPTLPCLPNRPPRLIQRYALASRRAPTALAAVSRAWCRCVFQRVRFQDEDVSKTVVAIMEERRRARLLLQ